MSLNLRSSLGPWFFGSSGRDARPRSRAETIGLFLLFLGPVFLICWLAFFAYRPIHLVLVSILAEFAFLLDAAQVHFAVDGSAIIFDCLSRPRFEANLSGAEMTANTPLLWALLVASPGIALRRRGLFLAGATGVLIFSQALFLVVKVQVALIAGAHPAAGSEWLWNTLDDLFEITMKGFVPVALWLYFALPYFLGRVDQRRIGQNESVGRNDPCPCGSGLKYKKCCG